MSTIDVIKTMGGGEIKSTPVVYDNCPSCGIRFKRASNIEKCWFCRNGKTKVGTGKVILIGKRRKS